jgi:hypothetical protein
VQDAAVDQVGHGAAGLKRRIGRQPRLGPQEAVLDLFFDILADTVVADVMEPGDERLIVVQYLAKHTERLNPRGAQVD